jgi:hypothetical protein
MLCTLYLFQKFILTTDILQKLISSSKDVNQGLISDYVEETYKEYFKTPVDRSNKKIKTKEIVVEKTDGVQKYVIPNYSPEETMNFFSTTRIYKL